MSGRDWVRILVNHGVERAEAEGFIADHGAARAYVWVRSCLRCAGNPEMVGDCHGPHADEVLER